MQRQTFRFVAAVNQGLGDPFEYKEVEDRSVVDKIKENALRYHNPFEKKRIGPVTTPINSSEEIARKRPGWRIVSKELVLFLRPGSDSINVDSGAQYACEVAGEFILTSKRVPDTTLKITTEGQGKLQVIKLESRGTSPGKKPVEATRIHGEYFVWDGRPFAVYRTDTVISNATDTTVGDLVFTKMVNEKPLRVQVLGRATANLIGSPVGGETGAIDGALLPGKSRRLVLTIDPEIQSATYFLLYSKLRELDADHPSKLQRPRKGAITILDTNTGQVLAHVGAPGYDPLWEGGRVILANRQRLIENPANIPHMPGSAVKVLTAGIGYLLFGDGTGEMLPASINKLAIRQAFRNAYGGPMPPENILDNTQDADVVIPTGEDYFRDNGGERRLRSDFIKVLNSAFYVMHFKPEDYKFFEDNESVRKDLYEHVALGDLANYFDASAKYDFFPQRSRFPVKDADSLGLFRQYAIGGNETRFTTLRLAAILGTVSLRQLVRPFIIESVFDPAIKANDNRVSNKRADVFSDFRVVLPDIEGANNGNDGRMSQEMERFLKAVCNKEPGTGWYLNSQNLKVFMTGNDPATAENENDTRQGDFGKTGTADNGKLDSFDDSVFVYKHGHYIIAVWMERASGNGVTHPAHSILNQVVRFIEKLEPPRT